MPISTATRGESRIRPAAADTTEVRAGVDVASVAAVAQSIDRFGTRYLERVFTALELASCTGPRGPIVESLAARFAAKEAAIKVLRPGTQQLDWRSIEVCRETDGSCSITLSGDAAQLARSGGLGNLTVALSHEGDVAVAVVIALSNKSQRTAESKGA